MCWASYQSPSLAHAITAGGAEAFAFPPTHAGGEPIGWWQQRLALQRARDDGAPLAAEGWMRLQHRLIVWKLACLQRCLGDPTLAAARQGRGPVPSSSSSAPAAAYAHPGPLEMLSASGVHRALIGRYEREHVHGARPALRRLMGEGEARPLGADAHLVLCICAIDEARGSLELTDGWYTLWAACDAALEAQLRRRRLFVGLKLRVWGGTEPKHIEEARKAARGSDALPPPPWEEGGSAAAPRLELHANGTRRAVWDAPLGLGRKPTFRVSLDSLQPEGGRAPALHVLVVRACGPLVYERLADGSSTRWLTLDEARHADEQAHVRAHERRVAKAARAEARAAAREARRRRASRGGGDAGAAGAAGADDDDDDDDDGDDDSQGAVEEPPSRSLVWKLTLVDAAPAGRAESLTASELAGGGYGGCGLYGIGGDPALQRVGACAVMSLWGDYRPGGEDDGRDGPLEGSTGWLVGASVKPDAAACLALATTEAVARAGEGRLPRSVALDVPRRGMGWVPDAPPPATSRRSSVGVGGPGKTAARLGLLAARGLSRVYTPLAALSTLPRYAIFDSVGYLVFLSAAAPCDASWGSARESRKLFLVDASNQLLCVNWVRPPSEPLPRLRVGAPLCVLNAKVDYTHTYPWPEGVQQPPGLESLGDGGCNRLVHHAMAEAIAHHPARLVQKMPGGGGAGGSGGGGGIGSGGGGGGAGGSAAAAAAASGLGHLQAAFEELAARQSDSLALLSKFSALAMDLVHGRLRAAPHAAPPSAPLHAPHALAPPPPSTPAQMPPRPSGVPPHMAPPGEAGAQGAAPAQSSPSSLTPSSQPKATPREAAVRAAVVALLQTAADGLTLAELAARMPEAAPEPPPPPPPPPEEEEEEEEKEQAAAEQPAEQPAKSSEPADATAPPAEGQAHFSAAEVAAALEALSASFVIFQGPNDRYRTL